MKRLIATLLLLLPTLCFGQGFGSFKDDQPFLAKDLSSGTPPTPETIWALRFWWVSEDLTLDTKVTSWTDRISSEVVTNKSDSATITNSANGVWFSGATYLDTSSPTFVPAGTNYSGFFVIVQSATASDATGFILSGDTAAGDGTGRGLYHTTGGNWSYWGSTGFTIGPYTTSQITDIYVDLAVNQVGTWTNGVFAVYSPSANNPGFFNGVGGNSTGNYNFKGQILEIGFGYGTISNVVSQLHQYATNKYGFSP